MFAVRCLLFVVAFSYSQFLSRLSVSQEVNFITVTSQPVSCIGLNKYRPCDQSVASFFFFFFQPQRLTQHNDQDVIFDAFDCKASQSVVSCSRYSCSPAAGGHEFKSNLGSYLIWTLIPSLNQFNQFLFVWH